MDSRDSSSVASRDGSSGDEDGLITVTAGLAKDALCLFKTGRFSECLEVLNQLLQKKPDDPKVIHNISVAEYFRDGCSDPRSLLEVFKKVKKRSEDLAHAAGEQLDNSSSGNSAISGSKGTSNTQHQFSALNASRTAYMDEFDTSIATLNIAVVFYHLHEYAHALSILEPLYQNIEPIDEITARQICLLLLDIALASKDATRAADIIQYVEKNFCHAFGQGDGGSLAHHQSSNQPAKASSAPSNSIALDASNADPNGTGHLSEAAPLARTLSDDPDYEILLSNIGGQNLARPSGFPASNDSSRTSADLSGPVDDLKLKLHLYKVRLLLLTRNLKAAKREVKLAMNIARGRDSSTALLLKSQLEYARGNHRKAIKLLMTSTNRTESWMPSIFNNNFACIFHQLRKHHTSTLFFSKALKSSSSLRSEKPLKLSTFSQDKSLLIVYNCGLQYLACGKPVVAACCFQKASLVFYNRALLWLRIAECCLLALEKGLLKSSVGPIDEIRLHVIGTGKWRQLLVEDGSLGGKHLNYLEKNNGSLGDDSRRSLSIPFARQCLLNALHLLNGSDLKCLQAGIASVITEDESTEESSFHSSNHKNLSGGDTKASNTTLASGQASANGDAKDLKGGVSQTTSLQSSVSSYEDICRKENNIVTQAVLADLAYVELYLENPVKALIVAKSLLRVPECSRLYVFLGHIYAAEALCHLNRPKEAAEHLQVYLNGNNVELPYSEEDREKCGAEDGEELNVGTAASKNLSKEESQGIVFLKPEDARGSLYVNLATMSAIQGDLEQAHRFAKEALSTVPNNPKAVLTSVYVDLLLGKSHDALAKLKQCSGVRFVPNSLTLDSSS